MTVRRAEWDHPRVGGEKTCAFLTGWTLLGSPPRRRGKVCTIQAGNGAKRITPAWAGKSAEYRLQQRKNRDHPRMGGEKYPATGARRGCQGSPPHGRGKVKRRGFLAMAVRITPAWAGKRVSARLTRPIPRDHPRMGGEKMFFTFLAMSAVGSPPHGRGKVQDINNKLADIGITPAWAGKSLQAPGCAGRNWDHPRMGGEKCSSGISLAGCQGSPPHGRGKVILMQCDEKKERITPAWAGKRPSQRLRPL